MNTESNAINWFDIPVSNLERAKGFYQKAFEIEMADMDMGPNKMAAFPYEPGKGKASGALVMGEGYTPSDQGPMLYLNANPSIDKVIANIESAGGKMLSPKMQISEEIGYMAIFLDVEGNRMALHAQN